MGRTKQKSALLLVLNHCYPHCCDGLFSRASVDGFVADAHILNTVALLEAEKSSHIGCRAKRMITQPRASSCFSFHLTELQGSRTIACLCNQLHEEKRCVEAFYSRGSTVGLIALRNTCGGLAGR